MRDEMQAMLANVDPESARADGRSRRSAQAHRGKLPRGGRTASNGYDLLACRRRGSIISELPSGTSMRRSRRIGGSSVPRSSIATRSRPRVWKQRPCGGREPRRAARVARGRDAGREVLASRGPGMHHVAYEVSDLRRELEGLAEQGVELIDEGPHRGLFGLEVAFVHPDAVHGVLPSWWPVAEGPAFESRSASTGGR